MIREWGWFATVGEPEPELWFDSAEPDVGTGWAALDDFLNVPARGARRQIIAAIEMVPGVRRVDVIEERAPGLIRIVVEHDERVEDDDYGVFHGAVERATRRAVAVGVTYTIEFRAAAERERRFIGDDGMYPSSRYGRW
jgi:hypothetical protein